MGVNGGGHVQRQRCLIAHSEEWNAGRWRSSSVIRGRDRLCVPIQKTDEFIQTPLARTGLSGSWKAEADRALSGAAIVVVWIRKRRWPPLLWRKERITIVISDRIGAWSVDQEVV